LISEPHFAVGESKGMDMICCPIARETCMVISEGTYPDINCSSKIFP